MSTNYSVTLDLKTIGSLDLGLNKRSGIRDADLSLAKLKSGFKDLQDVGGKFVGMLDSVADRVMTVSKWSAFAAGAAVIGLAHEGVTKLNAELEGSRIALGAIFEANHQANDFAGGIELARDQLAKMRIDAKQLPGELKDLQNIFVTTAIPGFHAGANADQLRELSAKTMAFAQVARVPQDQAAREMAMLLEGRSGAHNALGMKLGGWSGNTAEKFNKLKPEDRLTELNGALGKYSGSIERFARSYEGLSSTFIDNGKQFLTAATNPLFEEVKDTLSDVNSWFDKNETLVAAWAESIGTNAAAAFQWMRAEVEEWWPPVKAFFGNLNDAFAQFKADYGDTFKSIGDSLKQALADPKSVDNLKSVAEAYLAIKAASAGLGVLSAGASLATGAHALGLLGGGAGAAGGTAAAAGGVGAASAGVGLGTGALMLGNALLVDQAVSSVTKPFGNAVGEYIRHQMDLRDEADRSAMLRTAAMMREVDSQDALVANINDVAGKFDTLGDSIGAAAMQLAALKADTSGWGVNSDKSMKGRYENYSFMPIVSDYMTNKANPAQAKKAPGGHGGMTVQKVEIVVTSNQHPSRIARTVLDEFSKLQRNPRITQHDPLGGR